MSLLAPGLPFVTLIRPLRKLRESHGERPLSASKPDDRVDSTAQGWKTGSDTDDLATHCSMMVDSSVVSDGPAWPLRIESECIR